MYRCSLFGSVRGRVLSSSLRKKAASKISCILRNLCQIQLILLPVVSWNSNSSSKLVLELSRTGSFWAWFLDDKDDKLTIEVLLLLSDRLIFLGARIPVFNLLLQDP